MALVHGMDSSDWVKLACSVVVAIASALISASVRTWHDAMSPPAILGALVAVCSGIPAWFSNTPTARPKDGQ